MTSGVSRAVTSSPAVETSSKSTSVPKIRSSSARRAARRSCRGTGPSRTTVAMAGHSGRTSRAAAREEWRDTVGGCPARLGAEQAGTQTWTRVSWPRLSNARTNGKSLRTGSSCSNSPGGRCSQRRARPDADLLEYQPPPRRPLRPDPAPMECGDNAQLRQYPGKHASSNGTALRHDRAPGEGRGAAAHLQHQPSPQIIEP